jgi:hypothetical protein
MKRPSGLALLVPILLLGGCARVDDVAGAQRVVPPQPVLQSEHVRDPVSRAPKAERSVERTYTSPDGHLSFRYPTTWFIEDHWNEHTGSFLTNFVFGVRCCHTEDPDVKVDFWSTSERDAHSMKLLFEDRCHEKDAGEETVSCSQHDVNGRRWGWVETRWPPDLGRGLYALTLKDGVAYIFSGGVPEGPHADANMNRLRDIYLTLVLR